MPVQRRQATRSGRRAAAFPHARSARPAAGVGGHRRGGSGRRRASTSGQVSLQRSVMSRAAGAGDRQAEARQRRVPDRSPASVCGAAPSRCAHRTRDAHAAQGERRGGSLGRVRSSAAGALRARLAADAGPRPGTRLPGLRRSAGLPASGTLGRDSADSAATAPGRAREPPTSRFDGARRRGRPHAGARSLEGARHGRVRTGARSRSRVPAVPTAAPATAGRAGRRRRRRTVSRRGHARARRRGAYRPRPPDPPCSAAAAAGEGLPARPAPPDARGVARSRSAPAISSGPLDDEADPRPARPLATRA